MKISDIAAILALVQPMAVDEPGKLPTRGAGVDPRKVVRPGKRLRNWHRRAGGGVSLRTFARWLARQPNGSPSPEIAKRWLASKGARP